MFGPWPGPTPPQLGWVPKPHYINEFVFRFNRRRMPMAAFQSLLGLTAQRAPTTYKMLYTAEATG